MRMHSNDTGDIIQLVPAERFSADADAIAFTEYMRQRNTEMAIAQTQALDKRLYLMQHPTCAGPTLQARMELHKACYRKWNVLNSDTTVVSNVNVKTNTITHNDNVPMGPDMFLQRYVPGFKPFYGVNLNSAKMITAVEKYRYFL